MKELTKKQRRILQIAVAIIALVFMAGFLYFTQKNEPTSTLKNETVYVQNSKLQVFDDNYDVSQYPDRISLHYPYLLVIKPNLQTTYIYNLEQKKKEKEVSEVLLDYSKGNQLYNKGKTSYFNDRNLGTLCDKGFIKSPEEILCLVKFNVNSMNNILITINPTTQKSRDLYISQNLLTDLKVINNKIYLGEIDTYNHKNRILVDKEPIGVPNIISAIYEINGQPYFAAFKSELNQNTESYYLIDGGKVTKQEGDKIYLYK